MIDATAAIPAMSSSSKTDRSASAAIMLPARRGAPSIRRRQPPHRELDPPVRQFAPAFDLGHVGRLGIAAEHLARLFARLRSALAARLAMSAGVRLVRINLVRSLQIPTIQSKHAQYESVANHARRA